MGFGQLQPGHRVHRPLLRPDAAAAPQPKTRKPVHPVHPVHVLWHRQITRS